MKRWVGVAAALFSAGFAAAWVCLRSLLWVVVCASLAGCGVTGATVVLSTVMGTAGGAAMGAVVARSVASSAPAPTPPQGELKLKPLPQEWPALDEAEVAARKAVRP